MLEATSEVHVKWVGPGFLYDIVIKCRSLSKELNNSMIVLDFNGNHLRIKHDESVCHEKFFEDIDRQIIAARNQR